MENTKNLFIATILSILVMLAWHQYYEKPRLELISKNQNENIKLPDQENIIDNIKSSNIKEQDLIEESKRIKINSKKLSGSINLKGLRIDDLVLNEYKENPEENSENVKLLSPVSTDHPYFAKIGWLSKDRNIDLPNENTYWTADRDELTPAHPVNLKWSNKENISFIIKISLDHNYMFKINQYVENNSDKDIELISYGIINKQHDLSSKGFSILHEGLLGVFNDKLTEETYSDIKSHKKKEFKDINGGWIGITDKYWLASFIPDQNFNYNSHFIYTKKNDKDFFQVDYTSSPMTIKSRQKEEYIVNFFAGAKKVHLLDLYENELSINLFDRAVDFGWFYFLTKPMFNALNYFYSLLGNFGLSILMVTVVIKLLMFPLANKSYQAMHKMKRLQPKINELRSLHDHDKMKLNKEIMELYRREKVNPMSGCLPLFIQIPVFFSLYKVLFVTIEMRHAPFFGWINDLSSPDPTSIFNLFGLINWNPPEFMMIGIWPIIMCITMILQQKLNPEPSDPIQAKVMKMLPLIFLVMFSSFPSGLIIYWAWNNILSILQQVIINMTLEKNEK